MGISGEEAIRILIVDDDKDEWQLFFNALSTLDLPHEVSALSSGEDLFSILERGPLPHVIFMDINMPGINGLDCVKQLKATKEYCHIPVVMYSISSSSEDIAKAYTAGAHHYVVKPHASSNIGPTLRKALKPDWRKS